MTASPVPTTGIGGTRHYHVLQNLAEVLKVRRMEAAKTAERQTAFQRKEDNRCALAAECRDAGLSAVHSVHLRSVAVVGSKLWKASKDLAEEAERASFWLWLRRKHMGWAKQGC